MLGHKLSLKLSSTGAFALVGALSALLDSNRSAR